MKYNIIIKAVLADTIEAENLEEAKQEAGRRLYDGEYYGKNVSDANIELLQ